jgi:hypothetical protein
VVDWSARNARLDAALREARAMGPEWRSVKDDPPSPEERCWFWMDWAGDCKRHNPPLSQSEWRNEQMMVTKLGCWPSYLKAMLWQPLPAPPKES